MERSRQSGWGNPDVCLHAHLLKTYSSNTSSPPASCRTQLDGAGRIHCLANKPYFRRTHKSDRRYAGLRAPFAQTADLVRSLQNRGLLTASFPTGIAALMFAPLG